MEISECGKRSDEIDKRIDSRVDKLQTKFDNLKEESHALEQ